MKKLAIIALLASATTLASAATVEVELRGGRNFGSDQSYGGIEVGRKEGIHAISLAYDRAASKGDPGTYSWNRYTLSYTRDLGKIGNTTVTFKPGFAVIDPSKGPTGNALIFDMGISHPITSNVAFVADLGYQFGNKKVRQYDGGQLTAGLNFSF
jgi:hypothetical protein